MSQRRNSGDPSDLPPPYEEVVGRPSGQPRPTQHNSKPQPLPPRPNAHSNSLPTYSVPASSSVSVPQKADDMYTANLALPWRYPKDFFCKKCRNTGYKMGSPEKKCKRCWKQFEPKPKPIVYKRPPSNVVPLPPGARIVSPMPMGMPLSGAPGAPMRPMVVHPGHPSIGGVLCQNCGGRGIVSFFLDQETCRTCGGIGRVFPAYAS
ncbi:unnamed protein product [Kuraishia capsulata CBS 1993]|uniref:Uncharacterized protein n=1 Tax=Kuraishia capsulata CBS 1993 TaxID=1382522 RepID=W6MIU4_9ASCO|nr:uncharacterized protein KUCA_T00002391001 [Kuraishia capsulata CBS 1993]CDK26419.1 unnamed protein product [Kuraishia capsulata CBS 1993]